MITIQMVDLDPTLDKKSRLACGEKSIRLNHAGPHRNHHSLDPCPDPEFRTDLLQILAHRACGLENGKQRLEGIAVDTRDPLHLPRPARSRTA